MEVALCVREVFSGTHYVQDASLALKISCKTSATVCLLER